MKMTPILLTLLLILGGLSLITVLDGEETASEGEPEILTTDKKTYNIGEPVKIEITDDWVSTSTYVDHGYVITDEEGHWVRDQPSLTTCDVRMINGALDYIWNQKYNIFDEYDYYGNRRVHYSQNGEQVPPGSYNIHFIDDWDISVEIEIVDPL